MEKRIIEKKKKKNSWDSVLPRSGLNPGFLPDKGEAGVDSFNHMNAADFAASDACCEQLEEWLSLNEANTQRSDYIITRMCFAGRRLQDLQNTKVKNEISLDTILDEKNGPAIYDPSDPEILSPSTYTLMRRLDDHPGAGDKNAELLSKVVHHVFLVTTSGVPGTIIKYISPQDHARLHNFVTSTLSKLLAVYGKTEIGEYKKAYGENLFKKSIDGYARSLCLDAWIIRELYLKYIDPNSTTALYNTHQIELGKASGRFFVDHPEYITSNNSNILKIKTAEGDKHIQLIISTINDTQIKQLENIIVNSYIKEFPKFLESDFIGYIDLDNKTSSKSFSDFKKLFNNKLEEDLDEIKLISKTDLRNYLEHNLSKNIAKNKNEILTQMLSRYLTPELKKELFGDRYVSDSEKLETVWSSPKANKLKQLIIAQYVRYLLSHSEYSDIEIWTNANPELDENDLLYKLKPQDFIIRYSNRPGDYEIDLPRDHLLAIEDIYKAITDKKLIRIDIKDPHFLDASGNIVPGVKFEIGSVSSYDKSTVIKNILTTSSCDVGSIYKVIVDRTTSDSDKKSIGDMLKANHIDNVDTVEIVGDVLRPEMFRSLKCNNISFNGFTGSWLPSKCFSYIQCPTFVIPKSVHSLGDQCFYYSSLRSIFIPATITSLGDGCFAGCHNLTVNFEIDKSEFDRSRSKYSSGKYAGLNSKWGKTDVAKITYNNPVVLESLTEDDDFVTDDFGLPLFENNKYIVYKIEGDEAYNNLLTYLKNKGLDENQVTNFIGNGYEWRSKDYDRYFIEDKNGIFNSKAYFGENSSLRSFLDDKVNCKNQYLKDALADDMDLREIILFTDVISSLKNLREIVKAQKITKETPLDDEKYYLDILISPYMSDYTKEDSLLKVFLKYVDNKDYSAAFELADIDYPNYSAFVKNIEKALLSAKGKKLLSEFDIDENDAVTATNNFGELHDIIKNAAIKALLENMITNIKEFVSDISSRGGYNYDPVSVDFNKSEARLHLLDLYRRRPEITVDNLEDKFYDYVKGNILSSIGNTKVNLSGSSWDQKYYIKDNIKPYSFDQKLFLNNLEDNLKYYYR